MTAPESVEDWTVTSRFAPLTRDIVRALTRAVMPAYVYILHCADGRLYYGSTNDLIRRLQDHRRGLVRTTARRLPIRLVYFDEHDTPDQARQRERAFRDGRTRRKTTDSLIANFPAERLAPFA